MPVAIQPRKLNPRKALFVGSILLLLIIYHSLRAPASAPVLRLAGKTMGTTYSIILCGSELPASEALRGEVDAILERINASMSTYISDSEISQFNRAPANSPVKVSADFSKVISRAIDLSMDTEGAFDPTLGPLVEIWGFGPEGGTSNPSPEQVRAARALTGIHFLSVQGNILSKPRDGVQLDLNAIAKGYAVDAVFEHINSQNMTNVFVEIGGEVRVSGSNPEGSPWRIGIESPIPSPIRSGELQGVIQASQAAIATSGDYRNYREDESGTIYTHILDPRSGAPRRHDLASVTVCAMDCMTADAIATSLFVMGPETGLKWLRDRSDLAALFIVRNEDGTFQEVTSANLDRFATWQSVSEP